MANTNQKPRLAWETRGFEPKSFDPLVVATVFLVFVTAVAYALYSREWLTALTFVAVAISFIWYINQDKSVFVMQLFDDHITVNQERYAFKDFNTWWHAPANNMLYLQSTSARTSLATVAIPLGDNNIDQITAILPKSMTHIERSVQDIPDTIANWLRYQ